MNPISGLQLEANNNSWSHAYLFIGRGDSEIEKIIQFIAEKRGVTREDISRVIPEELPGKSGEIKIDQIRELLHTISLSPQGKVRIAVIFNCERLNQSSGNILLKSLEEPQKSVIMILIASKDSVMPTIKSRCRVIHFGWSPEETSAKDLFLPEIKEGFFAASKKIEEIVKSNLINSFLDELRDCFHRKMLETKNEEFRKALLEVEEARKRIGSNSNQRLTLENLVLKLEKNL